MALAASDKLIVPVNADDFSTAALRTMFFTVYGLYGFGGKLARYEKHLFHNVMKEHGMAVPKIHAILHNRSNIFAGGASAGFQAMNDVQAKELFCAFVEAMKVGKAEAERVFNFKQHHVLNGKAPTTAGEFAAAYTGTMRDMLTSAVATQHSGIPLWMVKRYARLLRAELNVANIKTSASSSLADIIGTVRGDGGRDRALMELIVGTPVLRNLVADIWDDFHMNATAAGLS